MNEQALYSLKYLLTNPYVWLFFIFIICLPYVFQYMRRFFPKKLQEQMAKEEACNLEQQQKPETKRMLKNMYIALLISLATSIVVSYFSEDSLDMFNMVFAGMGGLGALYFSIINYRANKDNKNCLEIYDKREFIIQISIYGGLVVLLILVIMYFEIGRIK